MARKRTNLAVAVDVPTAAEMLRIADQVRAAADASPGAEMNVHAARGWFCAVPCKLWKADCTMLIGTIRSSCAEAHTEQNQGLHVLAAADSRARRTAAAAWCSAVLTLLSFCCTQVGPHVCVLKTHVDIFDQWDDAIVQQLQALAEKHGAHT